MFVFYRYVLFCILYYISSLLVYSLPFIVWFLIPFVYYEYDMLLYSFMADDIDNICCVNVFSEFNILKTYLLF